MPVMVNLIASIIKRWKVVYEKTGAKVAVKRKNSVLSCPAVSSFLKIEYLCIRLLSL